MPVSRVVTLDDWAKVHEDGGYALVSYTASWCAPSRRTADEFTRLSGSRSNLHFVSVDVEEAEDVSQACGISSMPAFHVRARPWDGQQPWAASQLHSIAISLGPHWPRADACRLFGLPHIYKQGVARAAFCRVRPWATLADH